MAGRDERPAATLVAVLESRRLFRQALSIWLSGQEDIEFAGAATSVGAIAQIRRKGRLNAVVASVCHERADRLNDAKALARRFPDLRLIALCTDEDSARADELLHSGFRAVVPLSAGAEGLLKVLKAESVVRAAPATAENITATSPLTPRETEVLSLVGQGSTTVDISEQLGISKSTVANHKERIFSKLQANNQAHAVAQAVSLGIIAPTRDEDPRHVV